MTLEYHLQQMPWAEILQEAKRLNYRSHSASTCGLHVHISRMAFGCTYETQEECIARLVFFVEKFWAELLRFSRRTQGQLNRWAARYGMKLNPKDQMYHAKNSCAGRYTAVNLTNSDTVEIRIFPRNAQTQYPNRHFAVGQPPLRSGDFFVRPGTPGHELVRFP